MKKCERAGLLTYFRVCVFPSFDSDFIAQNQLIYWRSLQQRGLFRILTGFPFKTETIYDMDDIYYQLQAQR